MKQQLTGLLNKKINIWLVGSLTIKGVLTKCRLFDEETPYIVLEWKLYPESEPVKYIVRFDRIVAFNAIYEKE